MDRIWTQLELEARVVRYADLRPCYNAFIDTRTPFWSAVVTACKAFFCAGIT